MRLPLRRGAGRVSGAERGPIRSMEAHGRAQLCLCTSGSGTLTAGDRAHTIRSGTLALIPPGTACVYEAGSGTEALGYRFDVDPRRLVPELPARDQAPLAALFREAGAQDGVFADLPGRLPFLMELCELLLRCHGTADESGRAQEDALLMLLLTHLLPVSRCASTVHGDPDRRTLIRPALVWIEEHYMQDIRVHDLAASCALSESHFRKVFQRLMDMPPLEYVNRYRIQRSLDLLGDTDDTVLSISGRTGFSSIATFNRNFIRYAGCTPVQWRVEHRGRGDTDRDVQEGSPS